ncbi:MAG: DUF4097 family beta strand repeat protein [Clostridia bacterium]|nr:DUF4097 family beta strand repeat protein [Clostridia bacterium]
MKTSKKLWTLAGVGLLILGLLLCAVALAASGGFMGFADMNIPSYNTNTYEITEDFKNIDIDEIESDVIFLPSSDGKCKITATESEEIYNEIKVVGDTLTVTRKDAREWYKKIGFVWWGDITLTVYLPEHEYGELLIKTVSGDIDLSHGFTFLTANVSSTSGDIDFPCSASEGLTINTTSGNINLKDVTVNAEATVKSVSGDIYLRSVNAYSLSLKTTSGDIEAASAIISGKLHAKSTSGDVEISASDAALAEIRTTSGDVECEFLTPKNITTDTSSGDIRVPSSIPASSSCQIKTTSGDIKVTYKN